MSRRPPWWALPYAVFLRTIHRIAERLAQAAIVELGGDEGYYCKYCEQQGEMPSAIVHKSGCEYHRLRDSMVHADKTIRKLEAR